MSKTNTRIISILYHLSIRVTVGGQKQVAPTKISYTWVIMARNSQIVNENYVFVFA